MKIDDRDLEILDDPFWEDDEPQLIIRGRFRIALAWLYWLVGLYTFGEWIFEAVVLLFGFIS